MVVSAASHRLLIGYRMDDRTAKFTRLVLCDLQGGRVAAGATQGAWAPMALCDSGERVLMRHDRFDRDAEPTVELWTLSRSGIQRTMAWHPADGTDKGDKGAKWGAFLDEQRAVTMSEKGKLVVWNLNPLRPLYYLDTDTDWGSVPALSPDRKYLAFVADDQIGVLDVKSAEVVATLPLSNLHWPYLSFSPSGKRLACLSQEKLLVWEFETGELYRQMALGGIPFGDRVCWTSEQYILRNDQLIDLENQLSLWTYEGQEGAAFIDGSCWLVVAEQFGRPGVLMPVKLPHPALIEGLEKAMTDPDFFVLKPGVTVRLNVDAVSDPMEREKVRGALTERLLSNGFQVGSNGKVELTVSVEVKSEQVEYVLFGRGFQTCNFQAHLVLLRLVHEGKTIWEKSSRHGAPERLHLPEGKSLEQYLRENEKPDFSWLADADLPKVVAKSTVNGTLGQSQVTSTGIQDLPHAPPNAVPAMPRPRGFR